MTHPSLRELALSTSAKAMFGTLPIIGSTNDTGSQRMILPMAKKA